MTGWYNRYFNKIYWYSNIFIGITLFINICNLLRYINYNVMAEM